MTDPVRPVADSAEWWRQIAQRLAIDAFDLRAALDGLVGDFIKATEHEGATDCKKYPSYPKALLALNNPLAAAPVPCAASPADPWQPIETAPRNAEVFFWIVPKTPEESYTDSSGKPIVGDFQPFLHRGKFKTWGGLSKATHWMPLPTPPRATGEGARDEGRAMVSVQSSVDRSGGATDSTRAVVASDRPTPARDETGQALPLQQLRGGPENADAAPVAVSLDPHRLLKELIAEMRDRANYDFNFTQRAKDLSLAWVAKLEDVLARLRGEATVRPERAEYECGNVYHDRNAGQSCPFCGKPKVSKSATVRVEE
jgi:hypothetical protein